MTGTAVQENSDPLVEPMGSETVGHGPKQGLARLSLGAIGVVYGDIGTSPLYSMREIFIGHHPLAVDQLHIYGALSMIFWSLIVIVTMKYIVLILRADNKYLH